MKKNRITKIIASITAIISLCTAVPVASVSAAASYDLGQFEHYDDETCEDFMKENALLSADLCNYSTAPLSAACLEKCNYVGGSNSPIDAEDFAYIETAINALYSERGIAYDKNNVISVTEDTEKYDLNDDKVLTPDDYCMLLRYIQRNFRFVVNYYYMTATIYDYTGTDTADLVVPCEVLHKGRIFPVMEIAKDTFANHTELESVTIPNYEQPDWYIGRNRTDSFADNRIPTRGRVTASTYLRIQSGAFANCTALNKVYLPNNTILEMNGGSIDIFDNTPFKDLDTTFWDDGYVRYFSDSDNTTVIAYDLTAEGVSAIRNTHTLNLHPSTFGINASLGQAVRPLNITNIIMPTDISFIEDNTFDSCKTLRYLNGQNYNDSLPIMQRLVHRYIGSFDNTLLVEEPVQEKIDAFADEISEKAATLNDDFDVLVEVARKIQSEASYCNFYSINPDEEKKDSNYSIRPDEEENDSPKIDKEFTLYLNEPYYTVDMCRDGNNSGAAVFLHGSGKGYTECVGLSIAASLLMDRLNIRNYFCGVPEHALNAVKVNGNWSVFDMTSKINNSPIQRGGIVGLFRPLPADATDEDIAKNEMHVSRSIQFELFPYSKNKQLLGDPYTYNEYPIDMFHVSTSMPTLPLKYYYSVPSADQAVFNLNNKHDTIVTPFTN